MAGELQGIAEWRLLGVLREGERAVVYRARRDGDGADSPLRALKVLQPRTLHDQAETAAFRERSEVARQLGHPRIVATVAAGEADGRPWAAMELVEGVALDALPARRGGRLPAEPALAVLRGVLEALAAAGRAEPPAVHGRLDAGDVLLEPDGGVRLAGFGARGAPQTDLLAVARLAETLSGKWPPEVDAWLDRLQHGDEPFTDAAEALAALPPGDPEAGRKALVRAVRRAGAPAATSAGDDGPGSAAAAPEPPGPAGGSPTAPRPRRRQATAPREGAPPEAAAAVRQARRVAWVCLGVLVAAFLIEVLRFGGA